MNKLMTILRGSVRPLEQEVLQAADELERNETEIAILRDALERVSGLAGWFSDDDADPNDCSPEDQTAHVNGLIRQICKQALGGEA